MSSQRAIFFGVHCTYSKTKPTSNQCHFLKKTKDFVQYASVPCFHGGECPVSEHAALLAPGKNQEPPGPLVAVECGKVAPSGPETVIEPEETPAGLLCWLGYLI